MTRPEPAPAPLALDQLELLRRLAVFNGVLYRQGAMPIMTVTEAADLPADNLRAVVQLTADRLVTVARALDGIP